MGMIELAQEAIDDIDNTIKRINGILAKHPRFHVDVSAEPMTHPICVHGFSDCGKPRLEEMSLADAKQLYAALGEAIESM